MFSQHVGRHPSPEKTVQQLLQVKEMQRSDPHVVYDITGPFADLELEEFTSKLMPKRALDVGFKKYYCLVVSCLEFGVAW